MTARRHEVLPPCLARPRLREMSNPVLLTTLGSKGDLYPVLAVAEAIAARGHPVRLALAPEDAEIARARGLEAHSVGLSHADVAAELGISVSEMARIVFRDPSPLLSRALYPMSPSVVEALEPLARDASCVAGTLFALAGTLIAERLSIPYVPLLLQPMLTQSAMTPPRIPGFVPPMFTDGSGTLKGSWNRAWMSVVHFELRRRHAREQNAMRAACGLDATDALPIFGYATPPATRIGLWDAGFAPVPGDVTPGIETVGFPFWQDPGAMPHALVDFLDAGPAPLVITLGSVAHELAAPGFYENAVALARGAGLRVVILSGEAEVPKGDDICAVPYAPHAPLFARARAVVHHCGMGTTAQALRAGVPQLCYPLGADQPDNAAKVIAQGLGTRLPKSARGRKAEAALKHALSSETCDCCQGFSKILGRHGADRAARILIACASANS